MKMKNFVLMPARGLKARISENPSVNPQISSFLSDLSEHIRTSTPLSSSRLTKEIPFNVLDSIHDDGAKLIQIHPDNISSMRLAYPGLRMVPEVFFRTAHQKPHEVMKSSTKSKSSSKKNKQMKITVTGKNGKPVTKATVVGFTDFEARAGAKGITDSKGKTTLKFPIHASAMERLYIYPEDSFWPLLKKEVSIVNGTFSIALRPIELPYKDCVRYFYHVSSWPSLSKTLKVAVIDTGVGPHHDIQVVGGECTVPGEGVDDYKDYEGHGSHVAGIISAFARKADGKPGIEILSYRVFPKSGGGASNYAIVKAIDRAVAAGCHLINMSLGGGDEDDATKDAIEEAHGKGVICFVATGNDDRGSVAFPASFSLSLAVGAMGRKGTFPKGTEPEGSILTPYGKDKKNFVASFSNIGDEVDMIGPGVGIISCAPKNKYAVLSGTSMACPAVTGIAARLLLEEGHLIKLPPGANRADEMIKYIASRLKTFGFGPRFEGKGMPIR